MTWPVTGYDTAIISQFYLILFSPLIRLVITAKSILTAAWRKLCLYLVCGSALISSGSTYTHKSSTRHLRERIIFSLVKPALCGTFTVLFWFLYGSLLFKLRGTAQPLFWNNSVFLSTFWTDYKSAFNLELDSLWHFCSVIDNLSLWQQTLHNIQLILRSCFSTCDETSVKEEKKKKRKQHKFNTFTCPPSPSPSPSALSPSRSDSSRVRPHTWQHRGKRRTGSGAEGEPSPPSVWR